MSKATPPPWRVDPRASNHVVSDARPICSVGFHRSHAPQETREENDAIAIAIAKAGYMGEIEEALLLSVRAIDDEGWVDTDAAAHARVKAKALLAKLKECEG